MILFYAAGASSCAPHILLREAWLSFQIEKVDLATSTGGVATTRDHVKELCPCDSTTATF